MKGIVRSVFAILEKAGQGPEVDRGCVFIVCLDFVFLNPLQLTDLPLWEFLKTGYVQDCDKRTQLEHAGFSPGHRVFFRLVGE